MKRAADPDKLLDSIGWQILRELQENARISHSELGRRVGLSTPATAERVWRMEEAGIITGYHARVDPTKAGFPIVVYMRLAVSGGENMVSRATAALKAMPELLECHRITGTESFVMRVGLHSVAHLESLIDRLTPYGMTSTSTVLSSPVPFRALQNTEEKTKPRGKEVAE